MSEVRTRSRIAPAAGNRGVSSTPTARQGDGSTDWMKTGEAADTAFVAEQERQKQLAEDRAKKAIMPFRFYIKQGQEADIIILDDGLPPRFYEHSRWNAATKESTEEACPGEWDNCSLCEGAAGFKGRYFIQMFSIIDMRQVTIQKGKRAGTVLPYTRKLLPVKLEQQGFFKRLAERAVRENGGRLRGAHLLMTRDAQTGAAIGNPEFVEWINEETIMAEFSHPEVKGEDGKVLKAANADCYPYNYGILFPRPSGEDLRARYGGVAPAGSRQETQSEWGNHDPGTAAPPADTKPPGDTDLDDDIPFDQGQTAAPRSGGIARRAPAAAVEGPDPDDVPL